MTQARLQALLSAAMVALSATGVRAQDDVQVLDEKESDAQPEQKEESSSDSSDDDGGWSDDDYDDTESTGTSALHFGLRTGWGIPLGKSASTPGGDNDFSDGIIGQIPIWLDLGWQATPKFMAGLYFSYGFVLLEDSACPDGANCSASDIRLGLQFQYSFAPRRPADFWLGAGIGYEWAATTLDDNTATARGFEFLMLQLGVDFGGSEDASTVFGPFIAYTFARFDTIDVSGGRGSGSTSIDDKAFHNWLFLGLRAVMK